MSYSSDLKEYLIRQSRQSKSELAGFLHACGTIIMKGHGVLDMQFTTERNLIARHFYKSIRKHYQVETEVDLIQELTKKYRVVISGANEMLSDLGIIEGDEVLSIREEVPGELVSSETKLRSFVSGVFLGCGYLSNPQQSYHLEFRFQSESFRKSFADLLLAYDLTPKAMTRKGQPSLYMKSSEAISDFLVIIGATEQALALENMRVLKDVKNDVQRKVNCETANITKTVEASQKVVECIEHLQRTIGLSELPDTLREIALIRWEEPDLTLKEIGERLDPPLSKSGVNHRLERLLKLCSDQKTRKRRTRK